MIKIVKRKYFLKLIAKTLQKCLYFYERIFMWFFYVWIFFCIYFAVSQNSDKKNVLCTSGRRWLHRRVRRSCRRKLLFKKIPILNWLPNYRKEYIVNDMLAGITVGLTVIPQAIAYANVAGLPLQVKFA